MGEHIICPSCGKRNESHYKFCRGCGSELAGSRFSPSQPPPALDPAGAGYRPAPRLGSPGRYSDPAPDSRRAARDALRRAPSSPGTPRGRLRECQQCGYANDRPNRFCASCGVRLAGDDSPMLEGSALRGAMLTALSPDGVEAGSFHLPHGRTTIGRDSGDVFAGDSYLSPAHATFTIDSRVIITDEDSLNGVFRRLLADQPFPLQPGQIFRIGQELIRFEELHLEGPDGDGVEPMGSPIEGYVGRIAMVLGRQSTGTAFPVPETGLNLGRERGEVLFSDDGYVSGLHCRLSCEGGQVFLTDLGSSNGTFVRLLRQALLVDGDVLLMGQQLFRITI